MSKSLWLVQNSRLGKVSGWRDWTTPQNAPVMIQFSATLYGTLKYKPLLLNLVWGFRNRKGASLHFRCHFCRGSWTKSRKLATKYTSLLSPSSHPSPTSLAKPQTMAGAEHCFSLSDIPGSRRTHPCGIGTQATFPFPLHNTLMPSKLKQNLEDLLPCSAHYVGFMRVWIFLAWWQDGFVPVN